MDNLVNLDLLRSPWNWVIVFLILYFLALASKYVVESLKNVGISF
jgi:hypothetical protein